MQQLLGYFIDVKNMHGCNIKFDYESISLTREKHWYEILEYWYQSFKRCEELVPILHGVKFAKSEKQ